MSQQFAKPDLLAPQSEKKKPSYGLAFGKYIVGKSVGEDFGYWRSKRDKIRECRAYMQGNQSNEKYKQRFNATGDTSPHNLDWTPLGIGAKFTNALVDDILTEFDVKIKAIDAASMSKRRKKRNELLGNLYDKDFIEEFKEKSKIDIAEDEIIPESLEEVDLHMNINFKQSVEIAMQEAIKYTFFLNDYPDEVRRLMAYDIIAGGFCVGKDYLDPTKGIKTEHVDIEDFVYSDTNSLTGGDLSWAGEIKWLSIADIRRKANGDITEEQLKKIADKYRSRYGNETFYGDYYTQQQNTSDYSHFRQYDNCVIPTLNFSVKTVDTENIKIVKNGNKERRYIVDDDYKLPKKANNVSLEKDTFENVYSGIHVIGTDYIFNWGQETNISRPQDDLGKVNFPYKVYRPQYYNNDNNSVMRQIMPMIDQVNLAYLRMQQVIIKSRPQTTIYNLDALNDITMGGKDWEPLDLIDLIQADGTGVVRGRDDEGNYIQDPVREFTHQINIEPYIGAINFNIQLIREVLGFTPEREGQTERDQLVGNIEVALQGSRNATQYISNCIDNVTKRFAESIAMRVQDFDKESKFYEIYKEAIGMADMTVIDAMDDIPLASFGIFVDTGVSNEDKVTLEQSLQASINQKELRPEDAAMIREIAKSSGINAAYQYMVIRRKKYMQEQQQMMMMQEQQKSQMQMQAQQMQAQMKQQEIAAEAELEKLKAQLEMQTKGTLQREEYQLKAQLSEQEFYQNMQIEQIEEGGQFNREEYKQNRMDSRVKKSATYNAQQKQEIEKMKEGKQKEIKEENIGETNLLNRLD